MALVEEDRAILIALYRYAEQKNLARVPSQRAILGAFRAIGGKVRHDEGRLFLAPFEAESIKRGATPYKRREVLPDAPDQNGAHFSSTPGADEVRPRAPDCAAGSNEGKTLGALGAHLNAPDQNGAHFSSTPGADEVRPGAPVQSESAPSRARDKELLVTKPDEEVDAHAQVETDTIRAFTAYWIELAVAAGLISSTVDRRPLIESDIVAAGRLIVQHGTIAVTARWEKLVDDLVVGHLGKRDDVSLRFLLRVWAKAEAFERNAAERERSARRPSRDGGKVVPIAGVRMGWNQFTGAPMAKHPGVPAPGWTNAPPNLDLDPDLLVDLA